MAKELTDKQRIALVRKLSKKFTKKIQRNSRVRLSETLYLDKYDNGSNPNHYTDASKFANEYYGDAMRDTVATDNDWD